MKVAKTTSTMRRRIIAIVVILGMTGGYWGILQSLVWAKMVIDYARTAPLQTALVETFDGEHPCPMCKAIQKAKESQQRLEMAQPTLKLEAWLPRAAAAAPPDRPWSWMPAPGDAAGPSHTDPPPVPPPRLPSRPV